MITVVACPHPLRDTRHVWQVSGRPTVEDLVVEAAERGRVPLAAMGNAVVVIGDRVVPKDRWKYTRPKAGPVAVKAMPAGPAIPLIVSVAGFAASSWVGTLGLSALATGLLQAGIGLATSLLAGALSPVPKQRNAGRQEAYEARYSIAGVRNEARPYQPIPKIYGRRVRYYPLLAAQPYSEVQWGEEQYVRAVFDVGYGPLAIEDIRIGEAPIEQFQDVEYQVRYGYSSDTPITLFPSQVREVALNIQLRQVDSWVQQTTTEDTDEAIFDVTFPGGLQRVTDRNIKFGLGVSFEVQIRPASGGTWQSTTLSAPASGILISGSSFEIQANSKSLVRRTVRIVFPTRDQWQFQIRRLTQDDQADNTGDNQSVTTEDSYLTAFRSVRNEQPFTKSGIARIAVRMRATNQLNGQIEQLNCTVTSVLPVWDGSTWTEQQTRSPAWAFCDVLRGSANARPLAASRIDLARMLEWDAQTTADGVTFDALLDQRSSVAEVLDDIAATGNAVRITRNGLYSVALDNAKTTVVQHFTPRNSRNFQSTKIFATRPHGIEVLFPNEATYHQQDKIRVYDDGYNASNATRFETLELPFTTSSTQAWKRGRRAMFAARLRPEIYSIEADIEHIVCEPGDLVRVTHDVPLWGVSAARVRSLATSGSNTTGVVMDAAVTMTGGVSYACRFRLATGDTLLAPVNTAAGEQTALTFATPIATASGPAVGDLVLFGISGSESVELVVSSIEPLADMGARITFQDYAPEIQTADQGEVPEFDPQITLPPVVNRATPPRVQILSVDSDEDALIRSSGGTLVSRILIAAALDQSTGTVPAEIIQARYREANTTGDWIWLPMVPASGGELSVMPVQDGSAYTVELRSVSQLGATSDWTTITHTVIGKTTPPPDVERFYRQGSSLTWPYPSPPVDLAGFVLRANYGTSTDWGAARALHPGIVSAPPFDISALHGTQTILIKAVDTSGIESSTAASVTIDLGDLVTANVVVTQAEGPGWSGSLSGGTDTGANLEADLLSSPPFWGADAALHWGADGDTYWLANTYDSIVYIATYTPTSDILGDGVLKIDATVTGGYSLDYRISTSATFWGLDASAFWGADGSDFWDADTIGEWSPFPGQLGPFESAADSYQFRLTTISGATQGVVSQFDIVIDVPDLIEVFDDVVVSATSTRLPITKTYRAIKVVNVTVQTDGNGGVTARIIDKSNTLGPDIEVLNASGTAVIGLVDAVVQGY